MNMRPVVRNVALMVCFCAIGLGMFTENVRTVQVLGLFVTGVGFGAALATLISAIRTKQTKSQI